MWLKPKGIRCWTSALFVTACLMAYDMYAQCWARMQTLAIEYVLSSWQDVQGTTKLFCSLRCRSHSDTQGKMRNIRRYRPVSRSKYPRNGRAPNIIRRIGAQQRRMVRTL